MQPDKYQTVVAHNFQNLARPPKAVPVPSNTDAAEDIGYIQQRAAQVEKWCKMVNAEDILKQQLLESLDEKYFKGKSQAYINYSNYKLTVIINHLYDDHGNILPMEIEESEQKMKIERSLLYQMVDLF